MGRPKQAVNKSSSGKAPKKFCDGDRKVPKKSTQVVCSDCGICVAGLVVYPDSIDDDVSRECDHVFEENFQMFLRKQKDKNTRTSMQFKMKHEQRLSFAWMTKYIGNNGSEDSEKYNAHRLAEVGHRFGTKPNRRDLKWVDDILEGFDDAETLIAHLKELANDPGLLDWNIVNINAESYKAVKKDLVVSGRRWVVEQLDVALEEFKQFRDGLNEKEREKYDNLVEKQNIMWSYFECGDFSFEEVDGIIKEIQKEMDDIIARHNNQNRDIDSLVELIEGKQLGTIPKNKKEKITKSKKKKNQGTIKSKNANQQFEKSSEGDMSTQNSEEKIENIKSEAFSIAASLSDNTKIAAELEQNKQARNITKKKNQDIKFTSANKHFTNTSEVNVTSTQKSEDKFEKIKSEAFSTDIENFKSYEPSLPENTKMADELKKTKETLNITKAQLEETNNLLREEKLKNTEIADELKKTKEALNITKAQQEETKNRLREEKLKNTEIADELKKTKEALNITKAQQEETKNHLREDKLKDDHLKIELTSAFQENDLLISKLLYNDYKKYLDLLRQRQKNSFSVMEYLRASLEVEHTPQVQLALRSLHEFSARLLLADQQLSSQYATLSQQSLNSKTIPELHFDMSSVEPPDLGSSCINLLCNSILMNQSSVPSPITSRSSTSPLLGSTLPTSHARNVTPSLGANAATDVNLKPKAAPSKLANKISNKKVISVMERDGGGATSNTEDENCSICFEEMHPSNSFYLKTCLHRFHVTCLKLWLQSPRGVSSTCPMCRTDIIKKDKRIVFGAVTRF